MSKISILSFSNAGTSLNIMRAGSMVFIIFSIVLFKTERQKDKRSSLER